MTTLVALLLMSSLFLLRISPAHVIISLLAAAPGQSCDSCASVLAVADVLLVTILEPLLLPSLNRRVQQYNNQAQEHAHVKGNLCT